MAAWLGGWLAGWLAGIAIEVEFEVASRWAINAIIAIIINARTKPLSPWQRASRNGSLLVPPTRCLRRCSCCFYYCYGPITVSAINFPFCSSTTLITNATLSLLLLLLPWLLPLKDIQGAAWPPGYLQISRPRSCDVVRQPRVN